MLAKFFNFDRNLGHLIVIFNKLEGQYLMLSYPICNKKIDRNITYSLGKRRKQVAAMVAVDGNRDGIAWSFPRRLGGRLAPTFQRLGSA